MEHLLTACACGLDPATESMAVQAGIAAVISAPFWFREQIANGIGRLRGKDGPAGDPCENQHREEQPSD